MKIFNKLKKKLNRKTYISKKYMVLNPDLEEIFDETPDLEEIFYDTFEWKKFFKSFLKKGIRKNFKKGLRKKIKKIKDRFLDRLEDLIEDRTFISGHYEKKYFINIFEFFFLILLNALMMVFLYRLIVKLFKLLNRAGRRMRIWIKKIKDWLLMIWAQFKVKLISLLAMSAIYINISLQLPVSNNENLLNFKEPIVKIAYDHNHNSKMKMKMNWVENENGNIQELYVPSGGTPWASMIREIKPPEAAKKFKRTGKIMKYSDLVKQLEIERNQEITSEEFNDSELKGRDDQILL